MTLDLISKRKQVALDDLDGSLFELLRHFSIRSPEYDKINANYYGNSRLTGQVGQIRKETAALRDAYRKDLAKQLRKSKKVHSKDPSVANGILDRMMADDPWLQKFREILEVCDDSMDTDGILVCVGD